MTDGDLLFLVGGMWLGGLVAHYGAVLSFDQLFFPVLTMGLGYIGRWQDLRNEGRAR